jgi:hypothetical protein
MEQMANGSDLRGGETSNNPLADAFGSDRQGVLQSRIGNDVRSISGEKKEDRK